MQTDLLRKAMSARDSNTQTGTQDKTVQAGFLQDELMQELVQRKNSLESLVTEGGAEIPANISTMTSSNTLRDCVEQTLRNYFTHLDGQAVTNVYEMVLAEVEAPLLEVAMSYTQQNQCKAAELLGLSRGTLRKKLQQYGLL